MNLSGFPPVWMVLILPASFVQSSLLLKVWVVHGPKYCYEIRYMLGQFIK